MGGTDGAGPAPGGAQPKGAFVARHRRCKPTDAERDARRNADRAHLEEATRELPSSEGWQRWVKTRRSFHRYRLLIWSGWCRQHSDTRVECGRHVVNVEPTAFIVLGD